MDEIAAELSAGAELVMDYRENPADDAARVVFQYLTHRDSSEPPQRADVALGFASFDLRVAAQCANLYLSGVLPAIVFVGGGCSIPDGSGASDVEKYKRCAVDMGVPPSAIFTEDDAYGVKECVMAGLQAMEQLPSFDIPSFSLVAVGAPHAQFRIWLTLKKWVPDWVYLYNMPQLVLNLERGKQVDRTYEASVEHYLSQGRMLQADLLVEARECATDRPAPPAVRTMLKVLQARGALIDHFGMVGVVDAQGADGGSRLREIRDALSPAEVAGELLRRGGGGTGGLLGGLLQPHADMDADAAGGAAITAGQEQAAATAGAGAGVGADGGADGARESETQQRRPRTASPKEAARGWPTELLARACPVKEFRRLLQHLGLDSRGIKRELVARICEHCEESCEEQAQGAEGEQAAGGGGGAERGGKTQVQVLQLDAGAA